MLLSKIPADNFSNLLCPKNLPKIIQSGVINIVFVTKVQEIFMIITTSDLKESWFCGKFFNRCLVLMIFSLKWYGFNAFFT